MVILRTFLELSSDRHTWAWLSVCRDRLLEDTTSGTWDTPSHSDFSDSTVIFCSTVDGRQSQEKATNWDFQSGKLSRSPADVSEDNWKTIICLKRHQSDCPPPLVPPGVTMLSPKLRAPWRQSCSTSELKRRVHFSPLRSLLDPSNMYQYRASSRINITINQSIKDQAPPLRHNYLSLAPSLSLS